MFGAVDVLDDAVQKMLADEPCGDVERMIRIAEQVEFLKLREIAEYERSGDWAIQGFASTASALRNKCRMSHGTARGSARLARKLARFPEVAAAFGAGEISRQHVEVITRVHTMARAEMLEDLDLQFANLARLVSPPELRDEVQRIVDAFDGDGGAKNDAKQYDRNRLHASTTLGNRVAVDASLDAESGEIVMTALDAMQAQLRKDGDRRSRSAKQAEALTEICRQSLARDHKPASQLARRRGLPSVNYILDVQNYEADHPELVADIRMEAAHVGFLSRATLDRIACDCDINRIIMDGPSMIIDVGRTTRNVPDKLWRALVARDRHCTAPGCTMAPGFCDAHHVWYWINGGPTDLANLKLLCWFHHRQEHAHDAVQRR